MNYRPHTIIGSCPNCEQLPEPRFKSWFSNLVRMECSCGVSGAWKQHDRGDPWHDAVRGWPFPAPDLGPPPAPRK